MAIFDYNVYIMLHFPLSGIKMLYHGPHSPSPKENKHIVTLYKLHLESMPSNLSDLWEHWNTEELAIKSSSSCPSPLETKTITFL